MSKTKSSEAVGSLLSIPVDNILLTKNNPRTVDQKSKSFRQLVASVRSQGVIVPVHCRYHPSKKDRYELLAGERRLLASKAAALTMIPAISHGEISDEAAFEVTFTENFSREDLTPLEEGLAVAILLKKFNGDTKAVASKLGRTERWVGLRNQIQVNLGSEWKAAIAKNTKGIAAWSPEHFGLIGRLPGDVQKVLLKDISGLYYDFDGMLIKNLKKKINEYVRMLSKAHWQLDDPGLVKNAGPCSKCIKRSSSQPTLWDDMTDKENIRKNDRCLDKTCWKEKSTVFNKQRIAELRKEHPNLILITTEYPDYDDREELKKNYDSYTHKTSHELTGKTAKGAIPALVIYGSGEGQIKYIKSGSSTRSSGGSGSKKTAGQPTSLKVRRKQLESRRWNQVLRELAEMIRLSGAEAFPAGQRTLTVIVLGAVFGTRTVYWHDQFCNWKRYDQLLKIVLKSSTKKQLNEACDYLFEQIIPVLVSRVTYNGPISQVPDDMIAEAKTAAKIMGIDIKKLYADQVAAIKEPKSWQDLNADGTPKAAKAKTKTKRTKVKKTVKKKAK